MANGNKRFVIKFDVDLSSIGDHFDNIQLYDDNPNLIDDSESVSLANFQNDTHILSINIDPDLIARSRSPTQDLFKAILEQDSNKVQALLDTQHINLNERDMAGRSFLHYAIWTENTKIIELILEKGAKIEAIDEIGATPLYYATSKGNLKIIALLLKYEANIAAPLYDSKLTPLHDAVLQNNIDILKLFFAEENNINKIDAIDSYLYTPLHYAVQHSVIESNDYLNKAVKITEFLIDKGANIFAQTTFEQTCYHLAATTGYTELFTPLLKNIDPQQHKLDEELPFNIKANFGVSPLHIVASLGKIDIVKMLVEARANVNITNNNDTTPLHYAALYGHLAVVEYLIEHEADFTITNKDKESALDFAAEKNHHDIIEFILEKRSSQSVYIEKQEDEVDVAEEITDAKDDAAPQDADVEEPSSFTIMSNEDNKDAEIIGSSEIPNADL